MKTRTSIITAGAILALVIPSAAGAASTRANAFQVAKQTGFLAKTANVGVSGYAQISAANLH